MGALEDLASKVDANTAAVAALRDEIATLHERVEPMKAVYTVDDLWELMGGKRLCSLVSFKKSRLPPADGYYHRRRAYKRETVRAYLDSMLLQGRKP